MTDTNESWVDRYRPTTFDEIQGNTAAIGRIKDWAEAFPEDTTPRLLEGEPGTGKTSTVEVVADWLDLQLLELNASDERDGDAVERMARVIRSTTAEGNRRVVLLDEVDSWHHATNLKPLYDALENPANIVFATCNDEWETPSGIVSRCETEEFKLQTRSVKAKLKKVRDAEGLDLDDAILDRLAERPDLRSAINDLQVYGETGEAPADERDWEVSEWDMVDAMMTGDADYGDLDPHDVLLWLDENLKHDWRGLELAWGYEALARLDTAMMQDKRAAEAILDTIPDLRRTEPYYDDHIGRSKSFPEWFRHSKPSASGGSAEAKLYRELKGYEDGKFEFFGDFNRFRRTILPHLQSLDIDRRCRIIMSHGLSPDAYEALDVTKTQYEGWVEEDAPSEGDGLTRTQAADGW